MNNWNINEAVEYYKGQDAPQNQFALVELFQFKACGCAAPPGGLRR